VFLRSLRPKVICRVGWQHAADLYRLFNLPGLLSNPDEKHTTGEILHGCNKYALPRQWLSPVKCRNSCLKLNHHGELNWK